MRGSALILPALIALLTGAAACSDAAAVVVFTPESGILVRSETLTNGIGCGTADTQIFKYVALAVDKSGAAAAAGLADCFADAILVNLLPDANNQSLDFDVFVYAFNQTAYTASSMQIQTILAGIPAPNAQPVEASLAALKPTFSTTCTATQQVNIQVVATCQRLARSQ